MSQEPARALIVEDDHSWQQIVTEILTDLGLAVDVADTLEAAVEALAATPHRLAVVDLSLSGPDHRNRDGLAVLEAIRRQDPGCAAVLLTGFATVELAVSALTEYGALTCLRKESFRRAEFRQVVQRVLALAPTPPSPSGIPQAAREAPAPGQPAEGARQTATQILVVEDDAGWRGILVELLADAGYRPRACPSYGEALGLLRREKFELAVVDLSLASSTTPAGAPAGNRDGFEVLRGTKSAGIPTIVVSGLATPADVERLYAEFGIFAYLEKQQFERGAFATSVREALAAAQADVGEIARLTRRERDVMVLLVQGLTNKGIAREMVISENTVKRYLKSIFAKLDVDSRAAAVAAVLGSGSKMSSAI
jgi:DNA-binding NarL/FixJ family response regulator